MPITNPTAGDVHVVRPLTNFSEKWLQSQEDFVALRAFPMLPVVHQSDSYYEFSRADFYRDEAVERADGAESAGGGFTLSTGTYSAKVYAYHKDVTDRQRANQDSAIRLEQSAAQYVTLKLLLKREAIFASTFMGTGKWATDLTPSVKWDAATGTPITEIRTGKRTVKGATGYMPNRMILGRAAYDALLDNDEILDRIKGGATTAMPAMVMRQRLAELLELDQILVMDAVVNSAVRGATESTAFIVGDQALLYYAPNAPSLDQPTAGQQFAWTGLMGASASGQRIKRFRMEHLEADRIEGQMAWDYKITSSELGYFFNDVAT